MLCTQKRLLSVAVIAYVLIGMALVCWASDRVFLLFGQALTEAGKSLARDVTPVLQDEQTGLRLLSPMDWKLGSASLGKDPGLVSRWAGPLREMRPWQRQVLVVLVGLFVLPSVLLSAIYSVVYRKFALARWHEAHVDPLTGIANRRFLMEYLEGLLAGRHGCRGELAFIVVDVDDFKAYNDRYGHLAGDEALRRVARALESGVRKGDMVARMGGEEFIAVLPNADISALDGVCARLRELVEEQHIEHSGSTTGPWLTVSLGGCHTMVDGGMRVEGVLSLADSALYRVKRGGKNAWFIMDASAQEQENAYPEPAAALRGVNAG